MNARSPLDSRVAALFTAVALPIEFLGLTFLASRGMVMAPLWMAVCAIIILLVIVLRIFAISGLARIGWLGRR